MTENNDSTEISLREVTFPLRDYSVSLSTIKKICHELEDLLRKEAKIDIKKLNKFDQESQEEYENRKNFLRENAYKVTITINPVDLNDESIYSETSSVFDRNRIKFEVKDVYFTNVSAFSAFFNGQNPRNFFRVLIDFSTPPIFDPTSILSDRTTNQSQLIIRSHDSPSFFNAVKASVIDNLATSKTRTKWMHVKGMYDFILWLLFFPVGWIVATKLSSIFVGWGFDLIQPMFVVQFYVFVILLWVFRLSFSYLKSVFPVNVLQENKPRSKLLFSLSMTFWGVCIAPLVPDVLKWLFR